MKPEYLGSSKEVRYIQTIQELQAAVAVLSVIAAILLFALVFTVRRTNAQRAADLAVNNFPPMVAEVMGRGK